LSQSLHSADLPLGARRGARDRASCAVASWRDSASQQAQDDLDGLLNMALPFATQQLDKQGEFFPYGAALNDAGEARMVAGDPNEGDRPASTAVLEAMVEGLRRERDGLRAVALVADVRMSDGDAVRVELEHREGQAIAVLLPYKRKRFGRGIEYGSLTAGAASQQIWSA
jgi:hypothetical protein